MGWSGSRGGNAFMPLCFINSNSTGPTDRQRVTFSIAISARTLDLVALREASGITKVRFWRNAAEDAFRPVADIKRRREIGLLCLHHPRKARWGSAPKAYVAPMRFRNSATQLCWSAIRRAGPTARAMRPPSPAGPPQAPPWTDRPRGNATASWRPGPRGSRS